jgi:DNA-directed RNA polymerase subunit RPC12/RpoP
LPALPLLDAGRRRHMSKVDGLTCPRCGSADLELERAAVNGETADETTVQRCRQCGERFSITSKRD